SLSMQNEMSCLDLDKRTASDDFSTNSHVGRSEKKLVDKIAVDVLPKGQAKLTSEQEHGLICGESNISAKGSHRRKKKSDKFDGDKSSTDTKVHRDDMPAKSNTLPQGSQIGYNDKKRLNDPKGNPISFA